MLMSVPEARWLHRWMAFHFEVDYTTQPGAGKSLKVYILVSDDSGTTYEYGAGDAQPVRNPDFTIPVVDDTTAREYNVHSIVVPPLDFKLLVWNDTGQELTTFDGSWAPYNEEIQ